MPEKMERVAISHAELQEGQDSFAALQPTS